jgi:hypothetical protein
MKYIIQYDILGHFKPIKFGNLSRIEMQLPSSALEWTALLFITPFSLRMILWVLAPKKHNRVVGEFYGGKRGGVKQLVYLAIGLAASIILIVETSIVHYVVALLAVGALCFDLLLAVLIPNLPPTFISDLQSKMKPNPTLKLMIVLPALLLAAWTYYTIFFA